MQTELSAFLVNKDFSADLSWSSPMRKYLQIHLCRIEDAPSLCVACSAFSTSSASTMTRFFS